MANAAHLHNTMTNDEIRIRIKIAESLGWKCGCLDWSGYHVVDPQGVKRGWAGLEAVANEALPNYPESLDACAEFERTLALEEQSRYTLNLWERLIGEPHIFKDSFKFVTATPLQRCLAYLKTKGLIP